MPVNSSCNASSMGMSMLPMVVEWTRMANAFGVILRCFSEALYQFAGVIFKEEASRAMK